MVRLRPLVGLAFLLVLSTACGDEEGDGSDGTTSGAGSGASGGTGSGGGGGSGCDGAGVPEMTGPIQGLQPSYAAGAPIDISVPVDEDTARVIAGIYEVGTTLYLGGTAEDTSGPTAQSLSFFAGVADGAVGSFYLSIELCSTSVCTPPHIRNTYQRADRTAPTLDPGETYIQTREQVGGDGTPETCSTSIPIQGFEIQ